MTPNVKGPEAYVAIADTSLQQHTSKMCKDTPNLESDITVDTLVQKLRRMTYSKRLQREYRKDSGIVLNGHTKPLHRIVFNRNTPKDAVIYFDRYLDLQLPSGILCQLSDDDAAEVLFDMSNLPLEMALKRLGENRASPQNTFTNTKVSITPVEDYDDPNDPVDYDIPIREGLEFEVFVN